MKIINRRSTLRNKYIIIAGFSGVLILLGILMLIAMTRIANNNIQVNTITTILSNIKNVHIMRTVAHNRALILFRMAQSTAPFETDDMYIEFKYNASIFIKSSNKISKNLLNKSELDIYNKSRKKIRQASLIQNETAKNILAGHKDIAYKTIVEDIIPLQREISEELMILALSLQKKSDNEINRIAKINDDSNFLIGIIGVIAILLGILITFSVTRRINRSEIALTEQRFLAENASKAKSMFLATMSHEIRSPLAAIIGFSDLMRKTDLSQDKSDSFIDSIQRNSKHLLHLINDILDITKIEAGQLNIECINISPFALLDEFQSAIAITASDKGLLFRINYAFPLPEQIQTDPIRLKQILINLTSNAIKFTDKGSVNINVSCDVKNNKMIFEVIDTGIGLTSVQQEKIFDSFTQADSSTTRKYGGSGLGLNICKQLVLKFGGDITVESILERGSKFRFDIDVNTISNESLVYSLDHITGHLDADNLNPSKTVKGSVLLAEDTEDNQRLIEMYVNDMGADITIVENGVEAVKICECRQFDLILMDMQMPVMDGIEATQKIRETNKDTPIIALTANAMKSDYERNIDAGANEFLTKPIDVNLFNQILYKYLSKTTVSVASPSDATLVIPSEPVKEKVTKLQKLTEKFLDELPDRMKKIMELKDQGSWKQVEEETHKLKSLGTPFGFPEITELCSEINMCCRKEEFSEVPVLVVRLCDFCNKIN